MSLNAAGPPPIVRPRLDYGYAAVENDLGALTARYPFIHTESIGHSLLGRRLVAVRLGRGPRRVHYNASIHGNEWLTTPVLMRFIEEFSAAYAGRQPLLGWDVAHLHDAASIWLVPLVNPDGVELVQQGLAPDHSLYEQLLAMNGGSQDFRHWKANARGVDLNRQFNANWETARRMGPQQPGPAFFAGSAVESEPESRALADFTRSMDFRLVLAYHAQGEVIFWNYLGHAPPESETIVNDFFRFSGYAPIGETESHAGYKDWFILHWRRPGFTVEVGRGVTPLPLAQFPDIYTRNLGILLHAASV